MSVFLVLAAIGMAQTSPGNHALESGLPRLPKYVAWGVKKPHWVFVGVGHQDMFNALVENKISVMPLGWVMLPEAHKDMLPAVVNHAGWYCFCVDRDTYTKAFLLFKHYAAVHKSCVPAPGDGHPTLVFPEPSDHELILNFKAHRAEFEKIISMSRHNRGLTAAVQVGAPPDVAAKRGVSTERLAEFRRLMSSVGVSRFGLTADKGLSAELTCWEFGAVPTDDYEVCYAYCVDRPRALVKSIDSYVPPDVNKEAKVYRHIDGHWYLSFAYVP